MKVEHVNNEIWVYASNRKEWRTWLQNNHDKPAKVKLISYKKHTGKPSLSHKESMEEAICFGWIDTTIKRIDEDRFMRGFARRTDNSRWSSNTLSYAEELIKQGKMKASGLLRYRQGKNKPIIGHGLAKHPGLPKELKAALEKNKEAYKFFQTLAPSYRRLHIYMVQTAKRPETIKKRIDVIIRMCENHQKP